MRFLNAMLRGVSEGMTPPEELPMADWCAKNVQLVGGKGAYFDPEAVPGQRVIMEWLEDHETEQVNGVWPTGCGKSVLFESWICHIVSETPADCQFSHQTDRPARQWVAKRVYPALQNCSKTRPIMAATHRHKKRKEEMELASGCTLYFGGANMSNLQDKSLVFIGGQEMHDWPEGMIPQAKARTHDRFNAKICFLSQGGAIGSSWEAEAAQGELFESGFVCPKCKAKTPYLATSDDPCADFEGAFSWDGDLANASEIPWQRLLKGLYYISPCCGARWKDTPRNRKRLAESPALIRHPRHFIPGVKTHTQTAIGMPWIRWSKLVKEYLMARRAEMAGDQSPIAAFVTKRLARFWSDRIATPEIPRSGPAYQKGDYWPEDGAASPPRWPLEAFRFLKIDMQLDHYWAVIRAHRMNGESRLLYEGRIESLELVRALQLRYGIDNQNVAIDCGYEPERAARARHRYRAEVIANGRLAGHSCWVLLKGDKSKGFPFVETVGRREIRRLRMYSEPRPARTSDGIDYTFVLFSNLLAKNKLAAVIGAGGFGVPRDCSGAYFRHMKAEHKVEIAPGEFRWVPISRKAPNHMRDCETMGIVIASMRGILRPDNQ